MKVMTPFNPLWYAIEFRFGPLGRGHKLQRDAYHCQTFKIFPSNYY